MAKATRAFLSVLMLLPNAFASSASAQTIVAAEAAPRAAAAGALRAAGSIRTGVEAPPRAIAPSSMPLSPVPAAVGAPLFAAASPLASEASISPALAMEVGPIPRVPIGAGQLTPPFKSNIGAIRGESERAPAVVPVDDGGIRFDGAARGRKSETPLVVPGRDARGATASLCKSAAAVHGAAGPRNKIVLLSASVAAIPLAIWGWPLLLFHYSVVAGVLGWAAYAIFLMSPFIQIRENWRNWRALKKAGVEGKRASERLAGVNTVSQAVLIAGNLINFANFIAVRAKPALSYNAVTQAAGSVAILGQLALSRHFSRVKWAAAAAVFTAAAAASLLVAWPAAVATAFGYAAMAIFLAFTPPQILQNRQALAALAGADREAAEAARQQLKGVKPLYPLSSLLGNLLTMPVLMVSGHVYNMIGGFFGIVGPLFILYQLSKAGLLPKNRVALLAVGAAVFVLTMVAASVLAPAGFWKA